MRRIIPFLFGAFVIGWATMASGATITDLYGDKDGFDGFLLSDGSVDFNNNAFLNNPRNEDDESKTDFPTGKSDLPLIWTHIFDCSGVGKIISATVEIFAAGLGENRKIYIDDQDAGALTKSETLDPGTGNTVNYAKLDIINLDSLLFYLKDGELQIRIGDPRGASEGVDNFALDYSLLTITYESIHTPVPPSIVLLGSGLIGLITLVRKRSRYQSPIH